MAHKLLVVYILVGGSGVVGGTGSKGFDFLVDFGHHSLLVVCVLCNPQYYYWAGDFLQNTPHINLPASVQWMTNICTCIHVHWSLPNPHGPHSYLQNISILRRSYMYMYMYMYQ